MKQDQTINKRYVPYGINGEYFVYDNKGSQIPMGFGSGGKKKKIQLICDNLNNQETAISNEDLEHTKGIWNNYLHDGNVYCDGIVIANCYSSLISPATIKANAKFICEAVNNYSKLKEVNKELVEALETAIAYLQGTRQLEKGGEFETQFLSALQKAKQL